MLATAAAALRRLVIQVLWRESPRLSPEALSVRLNRS
jgi:hypothetical protein